MRFALAPTDPCSLKNIHIDDFFLSLPSVKRSVMSLHSLCLYSLVLKYETRSELRLGGKQIILPYVLQ